SKCRDLPAPRPPASGHPRSAPAGQGHRAAHPFPGQLPLHRGIPVDVPGAGHRVRRGARVPAGGRLPRDRLERVGADGPPVREDVPRGAREHTAPRGGSVGLVPVRAPLHQGGPCGGGRGRAGAGGGAPQRPCGRADVRRQSRVDRATRQGSAARAARDPRPGGVHAARARRGRAPAPGAHAEARPSRRGSRRAPDQRAIWRCAAPRVRRARPPPEAMTARCATLRRYAVRVLARTAVLVVLSVVASWRRGAAQTATWIASPPGPTVGDTIWVERAIVVPAGWQVRAGKLDATEAVEPLADPAVLRRAGGWVVRYAVVAWKPGVHKLGLPPLWLLGPDGRADSTAGGTTSLSVASVIPDSLLRPSPQGLLAPLRAAHRDPLPPLAALALAAGLLATGVVVRRRRPRTLEPAPPVPLEREVPDTRWLAAGEPKAVAE